MSILKNSLFANNITIRPSDVHKIIDMKTSLKINKPRKICIGEHVWIGENCTLLKGCSIPNCSVLGSCSVLTKSFDISNTLYVGVPAKLVKENIRWEH